jgi:hypothetical protein
MMKQIFHSFCGLQYTDTMYAWCTALQISSLFFYFGSSFLRNRETVSLTIQKPCQTPIAHELINQNVLPFFHTIPNQINKIPVMQPTKQCNLQTRGIMIERLSVYQS